MLNYREMGVPHEAQYTEGVAAMNAKAEELREQGLLPEKFPDVETELKSSGVIKAPELTSASAPGEIDFYVGPYTPCMYNISPIDVLRGMPPYNPFH